MKFQKTAKSYSSLSDEDLVTMTLQGQTQAFAELYYRYKSPLMGYYQSKVSDKTWAEDLTQKAFLKALENLPKFQPQKSMRFRPWFFALAYHLFVDHWRKQKVTKEKQQPYIEYLKQTQNEEPNPEELSQAISALTQDLNEQQKIALELRYLKEQSYQELAHSLGVKPASARQIVSRALKGLKLKRRTTK